MNLSISMVSSSSNYSSFNPIPFTSTSRRHCLTIRASSARSDTPAARPSGVALTLKRCAKAAILVAATAAFSASALALKPARAESPASLVERAKQVSEEGASPSPSLLTEFLGSNMEAREALKALLQRKLENGEDDEALKILEQLVAAQPAELEWKFLTARLLAEKGEIQRARQVFEEILAVNPLSFEALFENALLMDRNGESDAVIRRLEAALRVAEEENKAKEARDVKLIMAQVRFLQKSVDEALRLYEELSKEDPTDFRPYFCRGMIFSLLDRNAEAKEQFSKYRELSPKKFEVEGFLRTPLSRMKFFGTDEN